MEDNKVKDLEKKVSVLEQKLALYEKDATKRGYYALNRIVNAQVDVLNEFELSTEIGMTSKDDKKYDRTKAVWSDLKSMISDLNALKIELKITGDEKADEVSVGLSFLDGVV